MFRPAHKYAVSGTLIPDDDVIAVWNYYVQGLIAVGKFLPERQDLLISGLPRTLEQAKLLESYITVRHVSILEVHEEATLLERTQHSLYSKGRNNEVGIDVLQEFRLKRDGLVQQRNHAENIKVFFAYRSCCS